MHGGARGSGAQPGNQNAFRHGHYSGDASSNRAQLRELLRVIRQTVTELA
jgi:hypothetical protein